MYSGVNKYLTPCRFRKFGHLQRNPHSNLIPSFPPIEYATLRIFEWTKIPPEMCVNLVTNYKKRLTSVLANKGYSTKWPLLGQILTDGSLFMPFLLHGGDQHS